MVLSRIYLKLLVLSIVTFNLSPMAIVNMNGTMINEVIVVRRNHSGSSTKFLRTVKDKTGPKIIKIKASKQEYKIVRL